MAEITTETALARLRSWRTGTLPGVLRNVLEDGSAIIGGVSIGQFMSDAGGEKPRRSRTDSRRLRIVKGRVARAMRTAQDGRDGAISQITVSGGSGLRVSLAKGVDARVAPGAYNEGRVAVSGAPLSFLRPAMQASRSMIRDRAQKRLTASIRSALNV